MAQQQQARLVGPVQVVQEQHQRAQMRSVAQQRGDRLEQAEALLLGAKARRPVGGTRVLELGQDRGELGAARGDLHGQLGRRAAGDVVAQRLHERLVGNKGLLVAAARQHRRAPLVRRTGELPCQARLADPGLAREHNDAQAALTHRRPLRLQRSPRIGPADERAAVLARQQRGQWDAHLGRCLPDHLASGDRVGDALQRDRPERAVGEPAARADQRTHQLRGEDLAWRAGVAEPLGDHHRRAEVIALVADRLAHVQADANRELELAARIGAVDGLLDRDRACEGVDRAHERHHQPVAEVLDLLAAVHRRRLAQQAEVRAPQTLALLIAESLQRLGRADLVGEQQRHRARRPFRRRGRDWRPRRPRRRVV